MAEVDKKPELDIDPPKSVLSNPVKISRTDDEDTLVNVHVNNPLKKITKLLEDIKKQKAFSFSIKGSLGIAGIALVITTFGIFGGTKAFCSRGSQTFIGTLQVLSYEEVVSGNVPWIDYVKSVIWKEEPELQKRIIVLRPDSSILHVTQVTELEAKKFIQQRVFVTGEYDACSETLQVSEPNAMQVISPQ